MKNRSCLCFCVHKKEIEIEKVTGKIKQFLKGILFLLYLINCIFVCHRGVAGNEVSTWGYGRSIEEPSNSITSQSLSLALKVSRNIKLRDNFNALPCLASGRACFKQY